MGKKRMSAEDKLKTLIKPLEVDGTIFTRILYGKNVGKQEVTCYLYLPVSLRGEEKDKDVVYCYGTGETEDEATWVLVNYVKRIIKQGFYLQPHFLARSPLKQTLKEIHKKQRDYFNG